MTSRRMTYYLCLLLSILCLPVAHALDSSGYRSSSVLAQGKWVKVKVCETGMQEIAVEELEKAGFDDPKKVVVFGYGGAVDKNGILSEENMFLDDLNPVYSEIINDKLVFYGESGLKYDRSGGGSASVSENYSSLYGYYFLSDSRQRPQIAEIPFNKDSATETYKGNPTAAAAIHPLQESFSNAGAHLYSHNLMNSISDYSVKTLTLSMPEYVENTPFTLSGVIIAGGSDLPRVKISTKTSSRTHSTGTYLKEYGVSIFIFQNQKTDRFNPDSSAGEIDLKLSPIASSEVSLLAYEYLLADYQTRSRLNGEAYRVFEYTGVSGNERVPIEESGKSFRIWNIDDKHKVTPIAVYDDGENRYFSTGNANRDKSFRVVMFDPEKKLNKAEITGEVENQNIHALDVPEMIIISSPDLVGQAERLAEAHRKHGGLDVVIITPEKIYNEFSSGTPSPNAYRRMLKMFYDRDSGHSVLKYVMLMGATVHEQRLLTNMFSRLDADKFVLTFPTRDYNFEPSVAASFSSDNFIAFLSDNTGYDDLHIPGREDAIKVAVGRLPSYSPSQASGYVDKVIRHLEGDYPYGAFTHSIMLCDDGDEDSHMIQCSRTASYIESISESTVISRIFNSIYPWQNGIAVNSRRAMNLLLKSGASYMCYYGHGRPDCITAEFLISKTTASTTEYPYAPLMYFATCNVFSFDRQDDNFCEKLLYNGKGGALAIIAGNRTVYQDHNETLNLAFSKHLFAPESKAGQTYGDVFRKAFNDIYSKGEKQLLLNSLCYNYGGDPAIPIHYPDMEIKLESLNENDGNMTVRGGDFNRIKARIVGKDGKIAENFNGTVDIELYESPDTVPNLYQDKTSASNRRMKEVSRDETILVMHKAKVTNGVIDERFYVPDSRRPGEKNRIVLAAINNSKDHRAIYASKELTISDNHSSAATEAPVIKTLYAGDSGFRNGDIIPAGTMIYSEIDLSEAGLVTYDSSIGKAPSITLNGIKPAIDIADCFSISLEGTASFEFPLENIADGEYTLCLTVCDYAGNLASKSISFTVVNNSAAGVLTLPGDIVRDRATFGLEHNFSDEEPKGTLIVETAAGTPVFSISGISFPYAWDLRNSDGKAVSDGAYRAKALLNNQNRFGTTEKINFYILREPEKE